MDYDEECRRKLISAEEAARLVKSETWVDYGSMLCFPSLIDEALAKRCDELERVKRGVIASTIYAQDNQRRLARVFGRTLATGGTIADVQNWPGEIEKVTAEDVLAVARKYLDKNSSVTGYLTSGPKDGRI